MLREATRMVGVVPNAAYRHFADRDELLAAVCTAAMHELAARMAAGVARVRGKHGDPGAARRRLSAIGTAYLEFAREEPGLFATAFALPQQHAYSAFERRAGRSSRPWVISAPRSTNWSMPACCTGAAATASNTPSGQPCTGWQCSPGKDLCATSPTPPAITSRNSSAPSSSRPWHEPASPRATLIKSGAPPDYAGVCKHRKPSPSWPELTIPGTARIIGQLIGSVTSFPGALRRHRSCSTNNDGYLSSLRFFRFRFLHR